jgi:hypothetical protein
MQRGHWKMWNEGTGGCRKRTLEGVERGKEIVAKGYNPYKGKNLNHISAGNF